MNSLTKTILAGIAVAAALLFYMSYFVVDQTHKALVLRFGDIDRVVEEPGLYFKVPFADTVTLIDNRIMIWENNGRPVQDVASQVYVVDAFTLARIKDARLFRETLGADMMQAETRVGARLDAALRQTYGRRSFDAALSSDRATMMREIRDQLRQGVRVRQASGLVGGRPDFACPAHGKRQGGRMRGPPSPGVGVDKQPRQGPRSDGGG